MKGIFLHDDSKNDKSPLRAECYELGGDVRKAIKCIEKFINNTPDNLLIVKKCAKVLFTTIFEINQPNSFIPKLVKQARA